MTPMIRRARAFDDRESGAAMLIVMMVLLVVTASASLAVSSSQFELRAVGHQRQAMQTALVAEAGIVAATTRIEMSQGPAMIESAANRYRRPVGTRLSAEEPALTAENTPTTHWVSGEFAAVGSVGALAPAADAAIYDVGTARFAFEPRFVIDITDGYQVQPWFVGSATGERVDGNGPIRYWVSDVTSRGRMVRDGLLDANGGYGAGGVFTPPEAGRPGHLRRDIFETAATARAVTVSGPYLPQAL